MRVVITGSTSAIGRNLSKKLEAYGHETIPLGGRGSQIWILGEPLPRNLNADALVHLAFDRRMSFEKNILASKVLVESFQGYKLLLSSLSAHISSSSIYGRSKYQSEKVFLDKSGSVIRAGIVFGPESQGIFQTLTMFVKQLPLIPLPFSGRSRMFTSHIDDLTSEIVSTIMEKREGVIFAANPWPISLQQVIRKIQEYEQTAKFKLELPIPAYLLNFLFFLFKIINFQNPTLDSLKSLQYELNLSDFSQLKPAVNEFRNF